MLNNKKASVFIEGLLNKLEFKQRINDFHLIDFQLIHTMDDIDLPEEFIKFVSQLNLWELS